jgi:ectoine hydroxylase
MQLTPKQYQEYHDDGFLFIENCLSGTEACKLKEEASLLAGQDLPSIVREKGTGIVRAVQGCHLFSPVFERLTRLRRLLEPAEQIVGGQTYCYQFKINFKMAFGGDVWKWHQDYIYWLKEDGMKTPACTNVVLFLDEVNEFNGPLMLIPGSHRHSIINNEAAPGYVGSWKESFTADLKYSLDKETVGRLVNESKIVAPKGQKGSVLFFHPNIVHGSAPNMSPFDRTVAIITYNHVANVPCRQGEPRPGFVVSRDTRPISVMGDAIL